MINPYEEKHPEQHLRFDGTSIIALTEKGEVSIEYYGLDREELNEERRGAYNDVDAFVDILDIAFAQGVDIEPIKDKLKERVINKIAEGQHTLMIKCNFGKYL